MPPRGQGDAQQQQHGRQRRPEQRQPRLYLVGPWTGGAAPPIDPTQWGLSGTPLLASTTKQRTSVLVQRDVAASASTAAALFTLGQPMRPAVWAVPGDDSLRHREQRWVRASAPPTLGRRPREVAQRPDPELAATAP